MSQQWRFAEGVWVQKEENSVNTEQFRSISLLSVEGKIFFSIVAQWLIEYWVKNQYIKASVRRGDPGASREHSGVVTQLIR